MKELFYPNRIFIILFSIISFSLLILLSIFNYNSFFIYLVYAMSFYSLVIIVLDVININKKIRNNIKNKLYKNEDKVISKFFIDYKFKGRVIILKGLIVDFVYGLFKLISGIIYSSTWFITLAIYHLILGVLRLYLYENYKKDKENILLESRNALITYITIMLLNIPLIGIIILMILSKPSTNYPEIFVYFTASYAFYIFTISIINIIKYKKIDSPILSCSKVICFITALISILSLQSTLISAFGNDLNFKLLMNSMFGIFVILLVFIICIISIIDINNERKKYLKNEKL